MTKPTKSAEKPKSKQSKGPGEQIVAQNRSASYNYHILEKLEAGLVLHGTEVKALREGKANIRDAYVDFKPSGPFLVNAHIAQYMPGGPWNHEPLGERKPFVSPCELGLIGMLEQQPARMQFDPDRCEFRMGHRFGDAGVLAVPNRKG